MNFIIVILSKIYKIKKYYNFESEKINQILIKRYYKLKPNIIQKIIQTNSFEEIKEIMSKTIYKSVFTEESSLEENIDKYLYEIHHKHCMLSIPFTPHCHGANL